MSDSTNGSNCSQCHRRLVKAGVTLMCLFCIGLDTPDAIGVLCAGETAMHTSDYCRFLPREKHVDLPAEYQATSVRRPNTEPGSGSGVNIEVPQDKISIR